MSFISAPSSSAPSAISPVAGFLEGLGFSAEASRMLIPLALALLVIAGSEILRRAKFRRRRSNGFPGRSAQRDTGPRLVHGDDHMRLVAGAEFERTPLLNRSEARILPILEGIAREVGRGYRVMAQVSMGEILCAKGSNGSRDHRAEANRAINAKRLDFAIFDPRGLVVAAIEYQGSGHHLGSEAFMRDAVKREALRKAGINLVELQPDADAASIRMLLQELTDLPLRKPRPDAPRAQASRAPSS